MGWDIQAQNTSIPTKHSDVQAITIHWIGPGGSFYKDTLVTLLHVLLFNIPFFFNSRDKGFCYSQHNGQMNHMFSSLESHSREEEVSSSGGCANSGFVSQLENHKLRKPSLLERAARKPVQPLSGRKIVFLLSWSGNKFALSPGGRHFSIFQDCLVS